MKITWFAASDRLSSIGAHAPHISGVISPLHNALGASQIWWQFDSIFEHSFRARIARDVKLIIVRVFDFQNVFIKALLPSLDRWIVVGAQRNFEISLVIGRQFDFNVNSLA